MALFLGSKQPAEIYLGNQAVAEIYRGADLIYANLKNIYKDGVLMDGATTSGFGRSLNDLFLVVGGGLQTGPSDKQDFGYVRFDFTPYKTIKVIGQTWFSGYSGNYYNKKLGIDSATGAGSIELPNAYRGIWGTEGSPADFEETFDVSELTGRHTVAAYGRTGNVSDYYPAYTHIHITQIIGGR